LQTNFIKFLIEKYEKQIQELPEEETNLSDNKLSDEFDRIINGEEEREEIQDEVQDEPENDDENIDDLIKEYRLLEKKFKLKSNGYIPSKRK
jgi:CRISPR/Cas system-associated endonuclease/helicase Cas3